MPNRSTSTAKALRRRSTHVENLLWQRLRAKQVEGYKFRRQQPIGFYIVDFVCFERKLVIELDGGQHAREKAEDEIRDDWLKKGGFTVLRFWNHEVVENMAGILETVRTRLLASP